MNKGIEERRNIDLKQWMTTETTQKNKEERIYRRHVWFYMLLVVCGHVLTIMFEDLYGRVCHLLLL